jgi:hypothetical protein
MIEIKFRQSEKKLKLSFIIINRKILFLVHFPVISDDCNTTSTATSPEKPPHMSCISQSKTLSSTMQRSRWRKSKPWASSSSSIKRKYPKTNVRHSEAKWYLETISSINTNNNTNNNNNNNTDNTTISSTESTPAIDRSTGKLGK